jgi:hypothetical protein
MNKSLLLRHLVPAGLALLITGCGIAAVAYGIV